MNGETLQVVYLIAAYGLFALVALAALVYLWILGTAVVPNAARSRRRATTLAVTLPGGVIAGYLWAKGNWWHLFRTDAGDLRLSAAVVSALVALAAGSAAARIVWRAPTAGWSRRAAAARDVLAAATIAMAPLIAAGWTGTGYGDWIDRVLVAFAVLPSALALVARSIRRWRGAPHPPTRSRTMQGSALAGVAVAAVVMWASLPHRMVGPAVVELVHEPVPTDMVVDVVIDYAGCSGGQVPGAEDVVHIDVDESSDFVLVGVDVRYPPAPGGYTCEGVIGPRTRLPIALEEAVGDRSVRPAGPYEAVEAARVCPPRSTTTITLPPDASTLPPPAPDAPMVETGFGSDEPEVRYLGQGWCLSQVDALAIANVQLLTGDLGSDLQYDDDGNVTDVRFLIGGRDEGVADGEVLFEVIARDPDDEALLRDLKLLDELGARALQLAAERTGSLGIVHRASDARLTAGDFAHVRLIGR